MRLHVKMPAPSALKVLLFAAEAGQELETVEVDTRSPGFARMNPFRTVPVLETDSGFIGESLTICRYLDRHWGDTGLFGHSVGDQFEIEQWERRAELMLFVPSIEYAHHTLPMFARTILQQPDYAKLLAARARNVINIFEREMRNRPYVAGSDFSIADITAFIGITTFVALGACGLPEAGSLQSWKAAIDGRASGMLFRSTMARAGH